MRKNKCLQKVLLCIEGVLLFLTGIGLGWIRCRQTEAAFWEQILIAPEPESAWCVIIYKVPVSMPLSTGTLYRQID